MVAGLEPHRRFTLNAGVRALGAAASMAATREGTCRGFESSPRGRTTAYVLAVHASGPAFPLDDQGRQLVGGLRLPP